MDRKRAATYKKEKKDLELVDSKGNSTCVAEDAIDREEIESSKVHSLDPCKIQSTESKEDEISTEKNDARVCEMLDKKDLELVDSKGNSTCVAVLKLWQPRKNPFFKNLKNFESYSNGISSSLSQRYV